MDNEGRVKELEAAMARPDFWADKEKAQSTVREYQELKSAAEGGGFEGGNAVLSIYAGAGGDDAEDFARMLFEMYRKFIEGRGWDSHLLHEHQNDHGGYRNVLLEITGKGAYGRLKNEAGVHRLVRISPFNSNAKRQTSFALVEVLPKLEGQQKVELRADDLDVQFAKSGGAGGQNVNKRETAVRITHVPSGVAVHVSSERSQQANHKRAVEILNELVNRALTVAPKRKGTKVPKHEKRKRLEEKRRRSEKKQLRKSFE